MNQEAHGFLQNWKDELDYYYYHLFFYIIRLWTL